MSFRKSPYYTVFFQTRLAIDDVLSSRARFDADAVILLTLFFAFLSVFNDKGEVALSIVIFLFSVLFGYLFLAFLIPWMLLKISKLWNGQGTINEIKSVIALAQVPFFLLAIIQIISLLFGEIQDQSEINQGLQLVITIFFYRIMIIGLSIVHRFSFGKAIVSLVLCSSPFFIIRLLLL